MYEKNNVNIKLILPKKTSLSHSKYLLKYSFSSFKVLLAAPYRGSTLLYQCESHKESSLVHLVEQFCRRQQISDGYQMILKAHTAFDHVI